MVVRKMAMWRRAGGGEMVGRGEGGDRGAFQDGVGEGALLSGMVWN